MNRILITDDDSMMLRMAGFIVKKAGHEAVTASSGDECLLKMKETLPQLTVIDVEMPGKSGIETLEAIRADSELSGACVCLMTGTLTDEVREKAEELGALGCLGKPLAAGELTDMIMKAETLIGGKRI